ncbi:hypothetical protein ACIBO5_52775 [Nonomuraea angiospora]|uniref:hypothetical protein n=1 Tax=Nonomuraea angiospora TaxID=46172 RepID=UPI0037BDD64D
MSRTLVPTPSCRFSEARTVATMAGPIRNGDQHPRILTGRRELRAQQGPRLVQPAEVRHDVVAFRQHPQGVAEQPHRGRGRRVDGGVARLAGDRREPPRGAEPVEFRTQHRLLLGERHTGPPSAGLARALSTAGTSSASTFTLSRT